MANAGATVITKAPTYHGPMAAAAKIGSTAEDFMSQVENMIATQGWTDVQAAGHAISYLNGAARSWFSDSLKVVETEQRLLAIGSFRVFKALFKKYFFNVRTTFDLSVDWTGLKQQHNEDVQTFGLRVTATMSLYFDLFPPPLPRAVRMQEITNLLQALFLEFDVDVRAGFIAHHQAPLLLAINGMQVDGATDGFRLMIDDIILKLLSEGVRDEKMRELIRRHHKTHTSMADLLPLMTDLERSSHRKRDAASTITVPKLMAIAYDDDSTSTLTADEVALLQNHRRKTPGGSTNGGGRGNGRGGANARGGGRGRGAVRGGGHGGDHTPTSSTPAHGRTSGPPAPDSVYWTKICDYCHKYGHLADVCFKKQKDGKAPQAPAQVDYLGGGEGNAMGWM